MAHSWVFHLAPGKMILAHVKALGWLKKEDDFHHFQIRHLNIYAVPPYNTVAMLTTAYLVKLL